MTDSSMNFGPAWIRNLRSEGTTVATTGGGAGGGSRYQLAEYRYGREEMLALFDKSVKPPVSLATFKTLYSEQSLLPLALLPTTEEERGWLSRPTTVSGPSRGRGGSLERGGRGSRGRGSYPAYGRATSAYDSGWGNGEQPDWSPRKDFNARNSLMDNWRRVKSTNEEDEGWRNISTGRPQHEKWVRSTSWRADGDTEERNGPPERPMRATWHDSTRGPPRRSWDNEDHLPEWAMENPTEGGGTFDERGAFHGSDDEQLDRNSHKRDTLQKSTSQQNITNRTHPGLSSSKSAISLSKPEDTTKQKDENKYDVKPRELGSPDQNKTEVDIPEKIDKEPDLKETRRIEDTKLLENFGITNGSATNPVTNIDKTEEEDFSRMQEDFVLKLVVDEETPKQVPPVSASPFDVGNVPPPPNLAPQQIQEEWFYQDPQGIRQGPFCNVEMAEWFKAGYFSNQLNIMRDCDDRYFLLGELVTICGGENPFLSNVHFPPLKNEAPKLPDDVLSYPFLSQLALKQQMNMRNMSEPWNSLTLQQQELAQRLLLQPQQSSHDLQYLQQQATAPTNPLMFMINQMQQSNKLPGSVLVDKPSAPVPNQMDPLLMQLGNLHSLQNRLQSQGLHNHMPGGLPANMSTSLPSDSIGGSLQSLQLGSMPTSGLSSIPGLHGSLPSGMPNPVNVNRPTSHGSLDQLPSSQENDSITNFLKQFQQLKQRQQQMPMDSLWQKQQATAPTIPTQWTQQPEAPISMWDLQPPTPSIPPSTPLQPEPQPSIISGNLTQPPQSLQQDVSQLKKLEREPDPRPKEEPPAQKEQKKRKELDEKQSKKEAEERRKQEQKKQQESEKKAAEDKKKKEEEKIRKELEKARKEAEEKRLRELEEKRRLKEQRKQEEEAKKRSEELKKLEDDKLRKENKEKEERKQAEAARLAQSNAAKAAKTAPWCQSNSSQGMSLSEIQKAEKEKRAQEAALQLQKQHQLQLEELQMQTEKQTGIQLSWAKKPVEARRVKSLAEIQAEEQETLAKTAAEARLAAQKKEKEAPVQSNASNIWNGQSLTWANASTAAQWSSNSGGGFWDEPPAKPSTKPSTTVSKSISTSAMTISLKQQQQLQKQSKPKVKKEESASNSNNNNNNSTHDEFTTWCYKALSNMSTKVDIPTFVGFLLDIEPAYEVRDYCKDYLGDTPASHQFAQSFLEKRRTFKPKSNAHKDDMCSPAPAITPSAQHSTEFQEVKGKNKKNKKSKMQKVDSRILGFNVTSAPDRINVGDRDYGDM